jgi:phenylpyruvate tautomerase PptA (4-oxalocrotonate tautomerase family)
MEVKRGLARRLGATYARMMQTTPDLVTVAFRELEGGVWRVVLRRRRARTGSAAFVRHTAWPAA